MLEQHIPLIMEIIDRIVSPDERKRRFTDRQILNILIHLSSAILEYFRCTVQELILPGIEPCRPEIIFPAEIGYRYGTAHPFQDDL